MQLIMIFSLRRSHLVRMLQASKGRRGLGFSLTVSRAGQLIKLGSALDLATCRASRKGGGACESLVNKQKCEYCIYHLGNAERDYTSLRAGLKVSEASNRVFSRKSE